jgi:methylglutaconyl-CoA hydratase
MPDPSWTAELEATSLTLAGSVATVTLERPDAANARNQTMRRELSRIWDHLGSRSDVSVVILTGSGERFFCAGMDMKEAGEPESPAQRRDRLKSSRDIEQLASLPQPTIAAINGYALGGGFEMALACDIRVIAEHAQVGLTELVHGLVPGGGGTQRLPRLVGPARASVLKRWSGGSSIDASQSTHSWRPPMRLRRRSLPSRVERWSMPRSFFG